MVVLKIILGLLLAASMLCKFTVPHWKYFEIAGHLAFGAYCFWLLGNNITWLLFAFLLSEIIQHYFGRTFDYKDVVFDFIGAVILLQISNFFK